MCETPRDKQETNHQLPLQEVIQALGSLTTPELLTPNQQFEVERHIFVESRPYGD